MAILSITERNYKTVKSDDKKLEYSVEYLVETDSSAGPEEIRNDPLFKIGRRYSFGADSVVKAKLKSVSITRLDVKSRTHWVVLCSFTDATNAGSDENPGPGDDPYDPPVDEKTPTTNTRWQTFEIRFSTYSVPMYIGKWLGTGRVSSSGEDDCCPWKAEERFTSPTPKFTLGPTAPTPIINSAGQPLDPPINRTLVKPVFRYVIYAVPSPLMYEDLIKIIGKVNSDEVEVVDLSGRNVVNAKAGTLKCTVANLEPLQGVDDFAWMNFEFEYDECGHGELVPDKGRMLFIEHEDITTEGVAGGVRADIVKVDGVEVARDEVGDPIEEDIWLDGAGKKLAGATLPYFLKWTPAGCHETTFADKYPFVTL